MKAPLFVFSFFLVALLLSACISTAQLDAYKLKAAQKLQADHHNCETARVMTYDLSSPLAITPKVRLDAIQLLAFNIVEPIANNDCANPQIESYKVGFKDNDGTVTMLGEFYARHMTLNQAKLDPNIACRIRYNQVYQPPVTKGGAGRVISIPDGYVCTPKK